MTNITASAPPVMAAGQACAPVFSAWVDTQLRLVEDALTQWVPEQAPAGLGQAMRYAVLDGGKRLRPLLVLASAHAVASPASPNELALRAACAVELIHAYSLVHDDMPCMDNDVLRRGKPTVHVQFGQAQAMLAGDALQALAFELLLDHSHDPLVAVRLARQLAVASGHRGMAGGQAIDIAGVGHVLSQSALESMHRLKTGALLEASVMLGALAAQAEPHALQSLQRYGQFIGLAFQVVDDVLDVTSDSATLGKTAGKDAAADKPTFVSLMGLVPARQYANDLLQHALTALDAADLPQASTHTLRQLANWVVQRHS